MTLDIATPKGQVTVEDERKALAIFRANYPSVQIFHTPYKLDAKVDTLYFLNSELVGISENKCRYDMDLNTLRSERGNEWLVTAEKLDEGARLSDSLRVPFLGLLYLVKDYTLLVVTIYKDGKFMPRIRREHTKTRRTVNGGEANRLNAFICMDQAKVLK